MSFVSYIPLLLSVFLNILARQALAIHSGGLETLFQPQVTNDGKGNVGVRIAGFHASAGLGDIFKGQGFHAEAGWNLQPPNAAGTGAGAPSVQTGGLGGGGFNPATLLSNLKLPQFGGAPGQAGGLGGFNLGSLLNGLNSFKLPGATSDPRAGLPMYKNTGTGQAGGLGGFNLGSLTKGLNSFQLPGATSDPRAGLPMYQNRGATLGGGAVNSQAGLPVGGSGLGGSGLGLPTSQNVGYNGAVGGGQNTYSYGVPSAGANNGGIPATSFNGNGAPNVGQGLGAASGNKGSNQLNVPPSQPLGGGSNLNPAYSGVPYGQNLGTNTGRNGAGGGSLNLNPYYGVPSNGGVASTGFNPNIGPTSGQRIQNPYYGGQNVGTNTGANAGVGGSPNFNSYSSVPSVGGNSRGVIPNGFNPNIGLTSGQGLGAAGGKLPNQFNVPSSQTPGGGTTRNLNPGPSYGQNLGTNIGGNGNFPTSVSATTTRP